MNTTVMTNEVSTSGNEKLVSFAEEVMFLVKTSVVMTAMVVLLASAWV